MIGSRRLRALLLLLLLVAPAPLALGPVTAPAAAGQDALALLTEGQAPATQLVRESTVTGTSVRISHRGAPWPDGRLTGPEAPVTEAGLAALHSGIHERLGARLRADATLPGPARGRYTLHTTALPPPHVG